MKEIIRNYGEFFIEIIVISIVFTGVFNVSAKNGGMQGIFEIIGRNIPVESVKHTEYADFRKVYRDECNKDVPRICFLGTHLKVGSNKLADYFVAHDYEGKILPIVIKRVVNIGGEDVSGIYNEVSDEICFTSAGIYTLEIETRDYENRVFKCKIQLPVRI